MLDFIKFGRFSTLNTIKFYNTFWSGSQPRRRHKSQQAVNLNVSRQKIKIHELPKQGKLKAPVTEYPSSICVSQNVSGERRKRPKGSEHNNQQVLRSVCFVPRSTQHLLRVKAKRYSALLLIVQYSAKSTITILNVG